MIPTIHTVPACLRVLPLLPAALPGKTRLARWLLRHFMPPGPVEVSAKGITYCAPSSQEPVVQHLIADATYEPKLCAALSKTLKPDSIFIDVGANIGVMALQAAHHWCPQGRVLAFEASPAVFPCLENNATRNPHPALAVFHLAVTNLSGGSLRFYEAPADKFGMGSLANRFGALGAQVPTITLDDAAQQHRLQRVDVIKVDVEGFELGVFQGARRLLEQSPAPIIFFEFNDWAETHGDTRPGDAQRYLRSLGFQTVTLQSWEQKNLNEQPIIENGSADIVAFRQPFN
jgi:FkbM family methyltransferase